MAYSKITPLGSGEFALTKENFGKINDAVFEMKRNALDPRNFSAGVGVGNAAVDTAAFKGTVNEAAALASTSETRAGVVLPPGVFLISSSAALTPDSSDHLDGIHFVGCGMFASILRLVTSGSDVYFYDNVATARTNFCTFSDIGFEGMDPDAFSVYTDISNNAKGFRLWATAATGSHEQGFKFNRCRFAFLNTGFEFAGDQTTSEMSFVQCKVSNIKSTVYSINNIQSFNHEFIGTDIESIYGDVFSIGANGGGAIQMYGGSIIMFSDTGSDTFFYKNAGSSGNNANPLSFNGLRMEFRGNKANLCNIANSQQADLRFNDVHMLTNASSNLTSFCKVGNYSTVNLRGVSFIEQGAGLFQFHTTSSSLYGQSGTITFERCPLSVDWSDRCTVDNSDGYIRAIDCFGSNTGAPAGGAHWAHDFDLHWNEATAGLYTGWAASGATLKSGGSASDTQKRLKTVQIKMPTEYWPDTTEHTLKLPKNAIIKSIHLRKPPSGADTTSVTFKVGRNDKSGSNHLTSNTDQMKNSHTGDVTNYFYHVGATTNERTLRLYCAETPTADLQGGLCIIEYY